MLTATAAEVPAEQARTIPTARLSVVPLLTGPLHFPAQAESCPHRLLEEEGAV